MPQRIGIDIIERLRSTAHQVAFQHARRLRGLRYCDIRVEASEGRSAASENGQEKASAGDYGLSFGVRVLAEQGSSVAPGYFGRILGAADVDDIGRILQQGVRHALERARANARRKSLARGRFDPLAKALYDTELAPIDVRQDTIGGTYSWDPREVSLARVVTYVTDVSKGVAAISPKVVYNGVSATTVLIRELFCSSEGANIDHTYAQSEGAVFLVAQGEHGPLELYDFTGHQRGWELIEEGYVKEYIQLPDFMVFATNLAKDAVEIADAPPLKSTEGEVTVVTDPHYNALVVHEVIGHPSELDRALKYETGYAGRSWLLKSLRDNQSGRQVASPLVNSFSDPTMEGYGHYPYDHEGTPAKKVIHIRDGVYQEFLSSRQTAAIIGGEPNGHYKATDASLVPLIRMSNTAFAPGDRDPQEILKEVDRGYYVAGHRIPSVAESRENFRISAMKVYEIRNGELGQLYRDGAVMADSRDYFMRIDAVGNDFRMFPIPNCGKGQPMQAKRMGNGGPTMRSVARLVGGG